MNRRHWLVQSGAIAASFLASTRLFAGHPDKKPKRLLVFTRSAGFQHDVVKLSNNSCLVHDVMKELAAKNNFQVECTKDGRVFEPESLAKFDAIFFMTTGDLTKEKSEDGAPPMPVEGKKALLDAIAMGKGFIGSHCASDTFHSKGDARKNQPATEVDPFIRMLGGEFISHQDQQSATMKVADNSFPGLKGIADFSLFEEWYSLKNFQPDLHVILAQQTKSMKGEDYDRPAFPATWARKHDKGRVFYTSMGHREDVWTHPLFHRLLVGAVQWTVGNIDVDVAPNISKVTPQANIMPPAQTQKPK